MFPGIHALLASVAVATTIALGAFGVAGASRSIPAAIPLEVWRAPVPFEDRADWNPFANADTARRFQVMTTPVETDEEPADASVIANILVAPN